MTTMVLLYLATSSRNLLQCPFPPFLPVAVTRLNEDGKAKKITWICLRSKPSVQFN
ncbi:unnamed protein product [Coffea canephora]|uniref:Uncharacterized protein n=1 Tax=Coffea canephora TaxID=49390 RepID=A0A068V7I5_COFCA|nr:unnamed protein product [Coffea canephora]